MTNVDAAYELIDEAGDCLEDAKKAFDKASYNLTVRRAQETVELSLKGYLKLAGIEYPKVHDVGDIFVETALKYHLEDKETIKKIALISTRLAKDREPAFYMEKIYSRQIAENALNDAQFVFKFIKKIVESVSSAV